MFFFYANCAPQSSVSMSVRTECDSKDYLSTGLTQLPSLFFLFSLAYLAFIAFWIYFCYTNKRCVHRIHLLMAGLLLMNALNLICSAEDLHFVKVTGTPHRWDVLFYIFQFIRVVLLFTVIVLVGTGWSFLKPFLQGKDKKVLMIVIPLQVLASIASVVIGETGPFIKDWVTWNQLFLFVDIICCCAIIFPIVWSIRSLRETSKTDGKAASKTEDMEMDIGASSSSSTPKRTYDVFLSFRGEDTRYGFTGYLYNVLNASGFYTFMDDEELSRGEDIKRELTKAIEESKISIIVFSENYATSRWCLEELVKILECKKSNQQMVQPIFYNVDAGEVRNQTGNFGKAMKSYLRKKGFEDEKVESWRKALNETADLSGWPRLANEQEFKFIERIVKEVSRKLNRAYLHVADYPVGIDSHVQEINKLLQPTSDGVHMLGIYGLGGIGKTTIAKAVYNSLFDHFEGHSFLANVKEDSKRESDLVQLQQRLLFDILREKKWKVDTVDRGINLIKERLCNKKVLLILDDVDRLDQLEKLAIRRDSFGKGSIVIITTRDKHLLTSHPDDFSVYEVQKLNLQEAQQLFSWHSFKGGKSMVDYVEFVTRAIRYADGHPLALKVLGSHLCCKSKIVWKSALDKYKKNQSDDIHNILKISFDGLEINEKNIFLDIACFFRGNKKDTVEAMLRSCKFYPESGIEILIDKCLITIEDNRFWMHDLVQQMGREIVNGRNLGEPTKHIRLWFHEDNEEELEVLEEDKGLNKIHGIMLDFPEPKELCLSAKVFKKMTRLKVLIVRNAHFSGGFEYLPDRLMWLDWPNYPFPLSLDSYSQNRVVLNMPSSDIILKEPLINKFKCMIVMNLRECKFIEKVPDISGMPNLKELDVSYSESLIEVHQAIGFHNTLACLYLNDCPNLQILPSGLKMKSLMDLKLYNCSRLDKFPNILERMERLTELHLSWTAIKELPSSIEYLPRLEAVVLKCVTNDYLKLGKFMMGKEDDRQPMSYNNRCTVNSEISSSLNLLPWPSKVRDPHLNVSNVDFSTLMRLSMLRVLELENCSLSNLDFLSTLSCVHTLEILELCRNNFVTIPKCIYKFVQLQKLELWRCKLLQEIPILPPKITEVYTRDCPSLNSETRSRLLDKEFIMMKDRQVALPGSEIPKWFNIRSVGSTSISFFTFRNISNYALCIAFGADGEEGRGFSGVGYQRINGHSFRDLPFLVTSNNLLLRSYEITPEIKEFRDWNYIEIEIIAKSPGVIKELGIHVECTCRFQNCCCWKWVDEGDDVESNYPQDI